MADLLAFYPAFAVGERPCIRIGLPAASLQSRACIKAEVLRKFTGRKVAALWQWLVGC
jgi:hypothetical protein